MQSTSGKAARIELRVMNSPHYNVNAQNFANVVIKIMDRLTELQAADLE